MLPTPKDQRQMIAVLLLGILAAVSLLLIANDTSPSAVREVLAVALPPLALLAAGGGRGRG